VQWSFRYVEVKVPTDTCRCLKEQPCSGF
jgi:hypothetical protein